MNFKIIKDELIYTTCIEYRQFQIEINGNNLIFDIEIINGDILHVEKTGIWNKLELDEKIMIKKEIQNYFKLKV